MFVYILRSMKDGGIYIGATNNIDRRIREHNDGQVKSTCERKPFEIVSYFKLPTLQRAYQFEKYLKSGSGRAFPRRHF